MSIVIRASVDPSSLADELRSEVNRLDPALAVANVEGMDQIVHGTIAAPRFAFVLVGIFAALAILLSAIGIYGVIAYSVSQRTAEFGLRMALALGRLLRSLIYGVKPDDPLTLMTAAFVVTAVAVIACCAPAWKATRADPMAALRAE
jgi:ABC-type antimicrobial peptide transport system permease subunit